MKIKKAGLILMVVIVMSAVMAPAAQAQGLVEYAIILALNKVDTNVGPAWFTARSDDAGNVTAYLRIVNTSEEYRLSLDKLDAYILDIDTKERIGIRFSGQATAADGSSGDASVIVSNDRGGEEIVVIAVLMLYSSPQIEFKTEGTLTIGTPYSATDPLAKARIEPQTVDADGDGSLAESVQGRWSLLADGTARGKMVVSYEDDSRLVFFPKHGDLFCADGQLRLELHGPLFNRHPDGSIDLLGKTTVTVEPSSIRDEVDIINMSLGLSGSTMQFDIRGELALNVISCP
jgi:hypothetical protein